MKLNKKAMTGQDYLIGVFILLLSFFMVAWYFNDLANSFVSEADEFKCSTLASAKSTSAGKVADFFYKINLNCKKDNIEISNEPKQDVYETLADRSYSCYNRFGSGEADFMSNYNTEGNWCFICSKVALDQGYEEKVTYKELIEYMQVGTSGRFEGTYEDNINIVYYDWDDEINNIRNGLGSSKVKLAEIASETGNSGIAEFAYNVQIAEQEIIDGANKEFVGGDNIYIVYKFDRMDTELYNSLIQAGEGFAAGAAASIGTTAAVSTLLTGPFGLLATTIKIYKTGKEAKEIAEGVEEASKAINLLAGAKKFTKKNLYISGGGAAGVGTGTGIVQSLANFDSMQYVEVMNQEEYYRKCGTEKFD